MRSQPQRLHSPHTLSSKSQQRRVGWACGLFFLLFFLTPTLHAAPPRYTVKSGDILGKIAERHGCSTAALKRANRLKSDSIKVGQKLKLPKECDQGNAGGTTRYTVKSGDFLGKIAERHGCSTRELKDANRLKSDALKVGQRLKIPPCEDPPDRILDEDPPRRTSSNRYTVKPGDFLGKIAERHGCSIAELKRANHLSKDALKVGQRLKIPTCSIKTGGKSRSTGKRWGLDTKTLPRLFSEQGFRGSKNFKAYVIEVTFDRARKRIVRERYFDYNGTSDDIAGWNPASTIKIYAVIAAMQRVRARGFSHKAKITYHTSRGDRSFKLSELIEETIIKSNNITYDRLAQLASFDHLNGTFLSPRNGFKHSAIMRAYQQGKWVAQGESKSLKISPSITLSEGGRMKKLPAHRGSVKTSCGNSACTSLRDLGEAMRRLMLQEQLPASETFRLKKDDLIFIRRSMRAERSRGNQVVDAFARVFKDERVLFYSKPGFSRGWFSDNVYIFDPRSNQAWIVVMAGHPGRAALNEASKAMAQIIAGGLLRKVK